MKKAHILLLIVVIIAIGMIISLVADTSTYSGFKEASNNPGKEFHIIGTLSDKPILYDSRENPNLFSFYMIDNEGTESLVTCYDSKPQDFEKSEQVVIIGSMTPEGFIATSLLLKCPSKYNSDDQPEQFGEKEFGSS